MVNSVGGIEKDAHLLSRSMMLGKYEYRFSNSNHRDCSLEVIGLDLVPCRIGKV